MLYEDGLSGNRPGIQLAASVVGNASRSGARVLSDLRTRLARSDATMRRACRSPVPTNVSASPRGNSPRYSDRVRAVSKGRSRVTPPHSRPARATLIRLLIYELHCVKTVSELHVFAPLELLFEQKQVPQIIVNVRIRRKTMEPLESVPVPWVHQSRVNIPDQRGDWLAHTSCTQIPTDLIVGTRKREPGSVARAD
jgi:hypothetical protein